MSSMHLFRSESIENKRTKLEGSISLIFPPAFSHITVLIFFILVTATIFLASGTYTRKESVTGILQPNKGLVRLSAPNNGIVTELLVKEGQLVSRGQTLLRITSEKYGTEGFKLNQSLISQYQFQLSSIELQISREQSRQKIQANELKNNLTNLNKRKQELTKQQSIFKKRIELNHSIVNQISSLAESKYVSNLELSKQNDNLLLLKQQLSAIDSELISLINQKQSFHSQLAQLPIEHEKVIAQLHSQLEETKTLLSSIKQQHVSELISPTDGIVSGVLVNPSEYVDGKLNLLSVIPSNSRLQAVLYVPTSAFGFIKKKQETRLRYHAFPYEKFGTYSGTVIQISNSLILPSETEVPNLISHPSYRVVIELSTDHIKAYGRDLPLRVGMTLDADIVIESRSLLHWLFDPIISSKGQL